MKLLSLDVYNLRNIKQAHLTFSSGLNFISGENGAGKSSVLEAIHHLSTGNSFRTRHTKKIVRYNELKLSIRGELSSLSSLAIQKQNLKPTIVKINNDVVHSASELARYLPMQIIFDGLFQIIDSGPTIRRNFLDWGLFHVEPSYHHIFSNYKKALSQRNRLLKIKSSDNTSFNAWEFMMVENGLVLHEFRVKYLEKLLPEFQNIASHLCPQLIMKINYQHGWGQSLPHMSVSVLKNELADSRQRDMELGYSSKGPHRADLRFYSDTHFAKESLSRGQQKVVLIALKLAQGRLLSDCCLFLIDDLASELDNKTLEKICTHLTSSKTQAIITTLDSDNAIYHRVSDKWFHVDNGSVFEK